jgi:PLP dependent protein
MSIADSYIALKKEISDVKQESILSCAPVALLGVSKNQPPETVETFIKSGLRLFGENRVQEAADKWPELKKRHPDIELHLIGPLQTNKVKAALALFDVIQTVDREKLAQAISGEWRVASKENSRHSPLATHRFYIQVNTGKEPQKTGIAPKETDAFILYCIHDLKLPVVGLMCIPPAGQPPAPHFALLKTIADRHGLKELSMGMSDDYKTAIRMGSTCVRLGRALFGERNLES